MPCEPLVEQHADGKKELVGFLCWHPEYEFEGFLFEWHSYLGPMLVNRRTGEIRDSVDAGWYDAMDRFRELSEKEKETYRHISDS